MDKEKIFCQVADIARNIFRNEKNVIFTRETSPETVFSWNSLNHVILIEAVEKHFGISFDLDAMLDMQNLGDICDHVEKTLQDK